jgi:DNA primase
MEGNRSQIEDIKSRIDIESVIGRHVNLKKAGKNFIGLCPFHTEKTPSFTVSPSIQLYKCFGCGESGDVIKFLEKIEHLDFIEALEKLAKEAGVEIKRTKRNENPLYKKIEEINNLATKFYEKELFKQAEAKNYIFQNRKFKKETVEEFKVGYAPGGKSLLEFLKTKGKYSKEELLASGLFIKKNSDIKDRFFKRIIFPIQDTKGSVVGFTGRSLPSSNYGPKYLHTPETLLFKKSQLLYGLHQAKTHIREKDLCIVCEGTTDVISAHQENIKITVAPLGTAIAEEQLHLIGRNTKNILLLLDNDDAGKAALERYFILGISIGLNLYMNSTDPYKDLDELVKRDKGRIRKIIENKRDLFSYLVHDKLEKKDLNNHKDYKEIIEYVSKLISCVGEDSSREFFLKKAQQLTTIDSHFFASEEIEAIKELSIEAQKSEKLDNEIFLLTLVIYFEDTTSIKHMELKFFLHSEVKEILEYIQQNNDWNEEKLLEIFPKSQSLQKAILESGGIEIEKAKKDKYILNTYSIIKKNNIEKLIQKLKIKERIAIGKNEEEKIDKIETEITRLKKLMNEN